MSAGPGRVSPLRAQPERAAAPRTVAVDPGLDFLSTLVAVCDAQGVCLHVNAAIEDALDLARRRLVGSRLTGWVLDPAPLHDALHRVATQDALRLRLDAVLARSPAPGGPAAVAAQRPVHVIVSRFDADGARLLVEWQETGLQARHEREARLQVQAQAHKELVRNLAHEIGNPLGGIRGAAQLLQMQGIAGEGLEAAQLIVREADRLQSLVDRLLAPHRGALRIGELNLHEVCEHVRLLARAEFAGAVEIERDYDASLPEFRGDRERILQIVLNLVRNAAQALQGPGGQGGGAAPRIVLRTRAAHQLTIGGQRWRLVLVLQVEDNGPGVPEAMRERIFDPLVTAREGGSGLGLTLAQAFAQQHQGLIECRSEPGRTLFELLLPLP